MIGDAGDGALQEEGGLFDTEAKAREKLYERAQLVAASLGQISDSLKQLVAEVNGAMEPSPADSSAPLPKIVRILNNQLQVPPPLLEFGFFLFCLVLASYHRSLHLPPAFSCSPLLSCARSPSV